MEYKISYKKSVFKDLRRIDKSQVKDILDAIDDNLISDPHNAGKPLVGDFKGLFRFRVGDYRVIYSIMDDTVLVLRISHRKDIYR